MEKADAPATISARDSEMERLVRDFDWSRTAAGPIEGWPACLKTATSLCLSSHFQIIIFWTRELIQIYNDPFLTILGAKHPQALGARARDTWAEMWDSIEPLYDHVFATGKATRSDDIHLPVHRHGFLEESFYTMSYTPILLESGAVGGIFNVIIETTLQVVAERRTRRLRDVAARVADARSVQDVCVRAMEALDGSEDIRFASIHLVEKNEPDGALDASWPIEEVVRTRKPVVVSDVLARFGTLACGPWGQPVEKAVLLPLLRGNEVYGVLVAGVTPQRALDESFHDFLSLVAGHVSTAIANARFYEEERARTEELAKIDRAKTVFFSNVSHEFRTPLTLMLGPLEDALADVREPLPASHRERLELMQRNGLRLQKLVNALLDFSRIEAGRATASLQPVDLSALTRDLASSFRSAVEKAGIELVVDCPALPEPIWVDPTLWEKIVLNLLSNAFKFTFKGRIRTSLRPIEGAVELTVEDTGTGIPESDLPRIFERFHRVEGAHGRSHEGTGIGLALVQELVKLHGGDVSAESALGKGTTFRVRVPTGSAHVPRDRIAPAVGRPVPSSGATGAFLVEIAQWGETGSGASEGASDPTPAAQSNARILVADDNADMRRYVTRLLTSRWKVESVADGQQALESALANPPDLVLSDVMMPGLDGIGLLRALRADPRTQTVPVILLSARAGEEATIHGLESGADDYLVKPFSANELLARVNAQLSVARLRNKLVEDLERTVRFSEMVMGILGHDLRNPLAAITTAASLLERRADAESDDRFARPAGRILGSSRRMGRMIEQLLDFTRIRLGKGIPLVRARVNLSEVCSTAIEDLDARRSADVRLESAGDPYGRWDEDRLSQLVSNLLGNALAHGSVGHPIHLRVDGTGADVVLLEIANHGAVPPELLPVLFEPFRSGSEPRREGSSGLGLGLYIGQQIVLAHGGSMEVRSSPADGTRFVVRLPRNPVAPGHTFAE